MGSCLDSRRKERRGAKAPQATSNEEDRQLPIQPKGKRHILSISASLLLNVPLGTLSSSFLELNQNMSLPSVKIMCAQALVNPNSEIAYSQCDDKSDCHSGVIKFVIRQEFFNHFVRVRREPKSNESF